MPHGYDIPAAGGRANKIKYRTRQRRARD
jgi:hypothetical protein